MTERLVVKFGGTSVADIDRIRAVADRVSKLAKKGHQLVVVVSAMAGQTNQLVDWTHKFGKLHDSKSFDQEYDVVVSSGEQVTSGLTALALQGLGVKARSFLGWQAPIKTSDAYSKARILDIPTDHIEAALEDGCVVVVPGFQGVTDEGRISTLGRGGSDTSAVALAAALKADRCDIYTDVEGVYTTDPRVVPEARKLDYLTPEEMLEMASLGSKVLQTRCVEIAMNYGVKLQVLSSFVEKPGTIITNEEKDVEKPVVSSVAFTRNEAKVTIYQIPDKPALAARIFERLAEENVNVDTIVQIIADTDHHTEISFTVGSHDMERTRSIIEGIKDEIGFNHVSAEDGVSKVSIIGAGMQSHVGVAQKMFQTLADKGINIELISTSEIKVSVLIKDEYTDIAVKALHEAYDLSTSDA